MRGSHTSRGRLMLNSPVSCDIVTRKPQRRPLLDSQGDKKDAKRLQINVAKRRRLKQISCFQTTGTPEAARGLASVWVRKIKEIR